MIEKEISINARIRHPNIVQLMAISSDNEGVFLLQEYVCGTNMDDSVFDDEIKVKMEWSTDFGWLVVLGLTAL